jgi:hypothetical protein
MKVRGIKNPDGYEEFDNEIKKLKFRDMRDAQRGREAIRNAFMSVVNSRKQQRKGRKYLDYVLDIAERFDADEGKVEEIYNRLLKLVKQYENTIDTRCSALRGKKKDKCSKNPTDSSAFSHIQPPFLKRYCIDKLKMKTDYVINNNRNRSVFKQPQLRKNNEFSFFPSNNHVTPSVSPEESFFVPIEDNRYSRRINNKHNYDENFYFNTDNYNEKLFSHNLWKHLNNGKIKPRLNGLKAKPEVTPKQIRDYIIQQFDKCTNAIQDLVDKKAYNSTTQESKVNLSQPDVIMRDRDPMLFLYCYKSLVEARDRISDEINMFLQNGNLNNHEHRQKFYASLKHTIAERCLRDYALALFTYRLGREMQRRKDERLAVEVLTNLYKM